MISLMRFSTPALSPTTAVRSMMPTAVPSIMRKALPFWLQRAPAAWRASRRTREGLT